MGLDFIQKEIIPTIFATTPDKASRSLSSSLCIKLLRLEIINRNKIRFDEKRRKIEERGFVAEYVSHIKSILFIDECYYNYYMRPSSAITKYYKEEWDFIVENFLLYKRLFDGIYDPACNDCSQGYLNELKYRIEHSFNNGAGKSEIIRMCSHEVVTYWCENLVSGSRFDMAVKKYVLKGKYNTVYLLFKISYLPKQIRQWVKKFIRGSKR